METAIELAGNCGPGSCSVSLKGIDIGTVILVGLLPRNKLSKEIQANHHMTT